MCNAPAHSSAAERAATPVIGNLLLVGVVLVLGAAITITAVGLASNFDDDTPVAQFSTFESETGVGIEHRSGDTIDASNLYLAFEDGQVPVTAFTDEPEIDAGTRFTAQPRGADRIDIVWRDDEKSSIVDSIESYRSSAVFGFTGNPQTIDVSETETVEVELLGAGGEPGGYTNSSEGITDGGATAGGYISMTLDVSGIDTLEIYVGESPESTPSNPVGGWGWLDGGAPDSGANFVGGGGGGATAILGDGQLLAIAHGGGGADWDSFTFYPGGGGGGGGSGGTAWYPPPPKAGDGAGSGLGGDGAGQAGGGGGDESSFIPGTAGQAELKTPGLATKVERDTRPGARPGEDGHVRITYSVGA